MNPTAFHPAFTSELLRERELDLQREASSAHLADAVRRAAAPAVRVTTRRGRPSGLLHLVWGLARRTSSQA